MPSSTPTASNARAVPLFRAARWIGVLLLAMTTILLNVFPHSAVSLPRGFRTPILAFELAANRAEVEALFGEPGTAQRAELVARMDRGNLLDYVFMLLYASLLATAAAAYARLRGPQFWVAAVLAPLAAAADALENVQLFAITRSLGGDYDASLSGLALWTRLKWGALAFALAWLAPALLRGSRTERVVAALCVATGVLAVATAIDRDGFAESFSFCLSLGFVGLWIACLQRSTRA